MSTFFTRQLATVTKKVIKSNTKSTSSLSKGIIPTDILIVGAGTAGLTLATAIKNSPILQNYNTVIIDANDINHKVKNFYSNAPTDYHNRVVSITNKSLNFLTDNLKTPILTDRVQSYDGLFIKDGISHNKMELAPQAGMLNIIELLNIQSSLLKKLDQLKPKGFTLLDNCKVDEIVYSTVNDPTSWPIVKLNNGTQYKTRLLIGADGKNSPVRKFGNIDSIGWDYNTWGIVATLKLDSQLLPLLHLKGWQNFLKTGPIAHLPLPNDNASLVWSISDISVVDKLVKMDSKLFSNLINAAFTLEQSDIDYYFQKIKEMDLNDLSNGKSDKVIELINDINKRIDSVFDNLKVDSDIDEFYPPTVVDIVKESRAKFPLKFAHAKTYYTDRIALIGDAAHATHPLAGQGLNMGQNDVEQLVNVLEKATLRGQDIGSPLVLENFWSLCYPFNVTRLGMADKLHKLYHSDFTPLVWLRSIGLTLTDNISPIKNKISDILMGKS